MGLSSAASAPTGCSELSGCVHASWTSSFTNDGDIILTPKSPNAHTKTLYWFHGGGGYASESFKWITSQNAVPLTYKIILPQAPILKTDKDPNGSRLWIGTTVASITEQATAWIAKLDTERQNLPGGQQVFGNMIIGGYSLGGMMVSAILDRWDKNAALGGVLELSGFAPLEHANFNTGNYAVMKTIPYLIWHGNQDSVFNTDTRKTDFNDNIKGKIYAGSTANCKFVTQYLGGHTYAISSNLLTAFFTNPSSTVTGLTSNFIPHSTASAKTYSKTEDKKEAVGAVYLNLGFAAAIGTIV